MSHRVYIYNAAKPAEVKKTNVMVIEWGYEIPLLLQPLLIDGGFIAGNIYNTHTEPENFGLYFNAKRGIENIKLFYAFIEKHQAELIDNLDAFLLAKEKLFIYLDGLNQRYFHVDVWDVFNMNDESHQKQAEQLLKDIQHNNAVITKAVQANDISLLDAKEFTREVLLGFNDFKALLNYPDYNYGWEHIFKGEESDAEVEIYEENGLWGLKLAEDKILIKPYFDEFYGFSPCDLAVVTKDNKFGYVDKSGKAVIPLIYEDAYDFEGNYAVVKQGDKYGLINLNGQFELQLNYDDLFPIGPYNQFYCAKLDHKYGVINIKGKIILPFDFEYPFEEKGLGDVYFVKEKGKGARLTYSNRFNFLGHFDPNFIQIEKNNRNDSDIYFIRQHKYLAQNTLLSAKGGILVDGFEKIESQIDNVFIIRKHGKYGLLNQNACLLLNFEFTLITPLDNLLVQVSTHFNNAHKTPQHTLFTYLKIFKANLCGIYLIRGDFFDWVVPFLYEDIKLLSEGCIAVKQNGYWAVLDDKMKPVTAFNYEEVFNLISYTGIAYGLKEGSIYAITTDEVVLADKCRLQDYVDANGEYGYYYFSTEIQQKIQVYIDAN